MGGGEPRFSQRFLQLLGLSAFAVAQPVYDVLGQSPEFLLIRRTTLAELAALVAFTSLGAPALLAALEGLLGVASRRAALSLHSLAVATLVGATFLAPLHRALPPSSALPLALAGILGTLGALLLWRFRAARQFAALLSVGAFLFPLLFLSNPGIQRVWQRDVAPMLASSAKPTPVVFVVFDELPLVSLLDETLDVDPVLYPAFAALARGATWYRNATAVASETEHAIPAILTGNHPRGASLPILADHPQNLFTLLAQTHRIRAFEPITRLCDFEQCRAGQPPARESAPERLRTLGLDVSIAYLHGLLPSGLALRLPPTDERWSAFAPVREVPRNQRRALDVRVRHNLGRTLKADRVAEFEAALGRIQADAEPTLDFMHVALPHVPWNLLPSGRSYPVIDARESKPERAVDRAQAKMATALQLYRRHLLQVRLVDGMLAQLVRRLREAGIYDDCLLIVTADHGRNLRPGKTRRRLTRDDPAPVAAVPLFVKLPGQHEARVDARPVELTDAMPTVAAVLEIEGTESWDGHSLLDPTWPGHEVRRLGEERSGSWRSHPLPSDLPGLAEAVAWKVGHFGSRDADAIYRFEVRTELLGRATRELEAGGEADGASDIGLRLVNPVSRALRISEDAASLPAYVSGLISPPRPGTELAIALDGVVVSTARAAGGGRSWATLLDEHLLHAGKRRLEIFLIEGRGAEARLLRTSLSGS